MENLVRLFLYWCSCGYVYILELNNGKHYVGCTVNLKERYTRHKKGYVLATKPYLLWMIRPKRTLFNYKLLVADNFKSDPE